MTFDDLLTANRSYASEFALADIPASAARGLGLVTCMDSRIDPLATLGLRPGDAKIVRNAGGRVTTDVLRSLALAATLLGVTRIAVMHHTDCAMAKLSEADVRSALGLGSSPGEDDWDFGTFGDPDAALAADVAAVRAFSLLPAGTSVEGWRYDVATGLVARIVD